MDKYEFNLKVDQIRKLIGEKDYATAQKIADGIDWSRVRNTNLLSMIAEVYEKNGCLEDAKDLLMLAFERAPVGKRLLYKLIELSIQAGDLEEAEDYFREYADIAAGDATIDLLEYMFLRAKGAPLADQIRALERYAATDPDERWLYELAAVYDEAGSKDDCVRICNKILIMFGEGPYSEEAYRLKQKYTGLAEYQRYRTRGSAAGYAEEAPGFAEASEQRDADMAYEVRAAETEYPSDLQEYSGASVDFFNGNAPENERESDLLASQRYENEDAAFEAYLRYNEDRLSMGAEPEKEEKAGVKAEIKEDMKLPEAEVSFEEDELNEGFTDALSEEVTRIHEEVAKEGGLEALEADPFGQTRVLDDIRKERLRKVVIKDESFGGEPRVVAGDADEAKTNALKQAAAIAGSLKTAASAAKLTESTVAEAAETAALKTAENAAKMAAGATAATALRTAEAVSEAVADAKEGAEAIEKAAKDEAKEPKAGIKEGKALEEQAETPKAEMPKKPMPQARTSFSSPEKKTETEKAEAKEAVKELPKEASAAKKLQAPAKSYHMIIEAETQEDGIAIAIDELKYIHKEYGITNAAAKTTAEKLNQRGLSEAAIEKIRGKDFIIEKAGDLDEDLIDTVYELIRTDRSGMIVVLVDEPEGLDRLEDIKPELFQLCDLVSDFEDEYEDYEAEAEDPEEEAVAEDAEAPYDEAYEDAGDGYEDAYEDAEEAYEDADYEDEAYDEDDDYAGDEEEPERKAVPVRKAKKQTAGKDKPQNNLKLNVPKDYNEEMEIDDFAQYCAQFAGSVDCSITGKSMLALYERIELMEEDGIPLTKKTAEELIEEAADRAEKPPIGKRLTGMFRSKYDKNGLLILKEEDFIY